MRLRDSSDGFLQGAVSFETTHWSVVVDARDGDTSTAVKALEKLCRAYWYPLYSYVRRKGVTVADAQDLTQDFFCRLIEKNYLASVDRDRGSFRSFLLASIGHLLANEWNKARTLKRGGGQRIISFDAEEAEGRFIQEPAGTDSPERAFDRRWALTVFDRALARLREEFTDAGKGRQFDLLKVFLSDVASEGDYAALSAQFETDAGGVALAVHRLRRRYREIVRLEVAQTVTCASELDSEMQHLLSALD